MENEAKLLLFLRLVLAREFLRVLARESRGHPFIFTSERAFFFKPSCVRHALRARSRKFARVYMYSHVPGLCVSLGRPRWPCFESTILPGTSPSICAFMPVVCKRVLGLLIRTSVHTYVRETRPDDVGTGRAKSAYLYAIDRA